jgi:hypothetical protein
MAIYFTGGLTDKSAGQRPEPLECGRADLAHFSLTNPTETKRNRTCEKQNEFGFIVSGRRYFLVVDNWERPFALPTSPFLDNFRVADYYRPILWVTPLKSHSREAVFSSSWIFCFRREELRFRLRSWRVDAGGQSPDALRFCLSHFPSRRTSSKRIGPRAAPESSCGDARFVSAIRSSATDAAASKRMMNTTIGSGFGAVAVPVAGRPSPSCRGFRFLTHITAC